MVYRNKFWMKRWVFYGAKVSGVHGEEESAFERQSLRRDNFGMVAFALRLHCSLHCFLI